jgi:hypothetical protein
MAEYLGIIPQEYSWVVKIPLPKQNFNITVAEYICAIPQEWIRTVKILPVTPDLRNNGKKILYQKFRK